MRDPNIVLKQIKDYSTKNYKFDKLCKNLYNIEFYKLAYSNIYSKPGNMIKASDDSTIDGMSIERIEQLIETLKDGSYKPTLIKKDEKNKYNIHSFNDKLVQEIIRMILEAIYEDNFSS
jgi:hypothetical protein